MNWLSTYVILLVCSMISRMKHRIARECYISETNANLIGTAYSCLQEMGTMGRVVPSILALRGAMPLESSKARSHSSKIPIRGTVSISGSQGSGRAGMPESPILGCNQLQSEKRIPDAHVAQHFISAPPALAACQTCRVNWRPLPADGFWTSGGVESEKPS
jgi:hypothetical protein